MYARIERGVSPGGVTVTAEDGSSFFVPFKLAETFGLVRGQELTEEQFHALGSRVEQALARKKAMDLLSMREHSCIELSRKLQERGFQSECVETVVRELADSGLQSDRRFAENWVRSRMRRSPAGPVVLAAGLASKGISREMAEDVLQEMLDDELQEQALKDAAGKLLRKRGMTRDKFMQGLLRRGFRFNEVISVADKAFPEEWD